MSADPTDSPAPTPADDSPSPAAAVVDASLEAAAAQPAAAAASSDDAAAEPAAASSSSSAAAAAAAAAVAASSASLSDLMADDTDEMAEEALAERRAQQEQEAADAADTAAADSTEADAAAAAGDTAMDDTAAAEGADDTAAEDAVAAADGDDPAAALESTMLSHCRAILASLSLAQVQKSSKSHMLDKLKAAMGKKLIKRNKDMATRVARQAASERLAELEKSGGDDAAAAAAAEEEEDARPLAAYQDEDEDDEEPKKKAGGKKRLRKSAGSDAEDDADDDGDYNEGSSSKQKKKSKKSTKKSAAAAAAAASSEPASSTVALLAFEAPKTPYQIFQSLERRSMKDEHPDATPSELSKLIVAKWNELDEDAKAEFEALARKQKTDHAADLQRLRDEDPVAYEKHMKAVRKREEEQLLGPGGKKKKGGAGHDDEDPDSSPPSAPVEQSYFDSIISALKPKKKSKKDYSSDEMMAQMREKEQAFIDKMINVAKLDQAANEAGKPAVHKLKMLDDVQAQLSKREVADRMMDSGLLRALCLWIAPEADGSLPNVRLRTVVYQILATLRVTETSLASSQGLGKRIMRLWKDPAELLSNKRLLSDLMEKWMRPMLGLSTDYAKASELEEERAQDIFRRKAIIDSAPKAPNYNPKRARIPEPARFDYAIRPQAANERENQDEAIEVGGGKQKKEETRKQQMHKRLDKMGKSGSIVKPKFKVDITGRGSNM